MSKYKILVVDDDEAVAASLKDTLDMLKIYDVSVANSGKEALEYLDKWRFDLWIVDQIMPEMAGVEFIKEGLKRINGESERPIIVGLTAEDNGVMLSAAETGKIMIDQYILKPWKRSDFSVGLKISLEKRSMRNDLLNSLENHYNDQLLKQHLLDEALSKLSKKERQQVTISGAITALKGIKHEIGNITTGIMGGNRSLGYFIEDAKGEIETGHWGKLNTIYTDLDGLSDRLKKCTVFIADIAGKVTEPKVNVLLGDIIDSSLEVLSNEIAQMNIKVLRFYEKNIVISCYEMVLKLAINQILKNGIEWMPEGGTLTITTYTETTKAIIKIRDTGVGMTEETAMNLFVPFFTQQKIYGGKGGSIAHKVIIGDHHGSIDVESYTEETIKSKQYPDKSRGTTVIISLPLALN